MNQAESHIAVEQVQLALANIARLSISLPLFTIMFIWVLYYHAGHSQAVLRWGALVVPYYIVYTQYARYRLAKEISVEDTRRIIRQLIVMSAILGACWGALPWVAFNPTYVAASILIVSLISGSGAAMMASLAPVLPAFIAYICIESPAMATKFFSMGHTIYYLLALAGPLYMATLIGMARNSNQAARKAIMLQFENTELVEKLQREKAHAQSAHNEAERANQAKTRFLAAASHDLRQPIHALGLFLEMLDRGELDAEQKKTLVRARESWLASHDMLDTLLDFSRIEAGVVEPHSQPFYIQPLLNKLEHELAPQANQKGLSYRTRTINLVVDSDPVLVELMLRNLITNAIRYTEHGGVLVGCRKRGQYVVVEVWDTGIGIRQEQQQSVFHEFHQIGNEERDRRKGLGLGLAITEGLSRVLGHQLSLFSTPQRGSVFKLTLPITSKPVIEQSLLTSRVQPREMGLKILVIDDDEAIQDGMQQLLEGWGCESKIAESIEQALTIAETYQPDLLISDYRLRNEQTGGEAIAALRNKLGMQLPAILVTGDTAPERLREASANNVPLLHKPFSSSQLYQLITGVLEPI